MRRWIAVLSLLSLANNAFVNGGLSCPLVGNEQHQEHAPSAAAVTHEGHDMGTNDDLPASGDDLRHEAACLTMGPCVLTIDVIRALSAAGRLPHADAVAARSDHLPASQTLSPELPPPRA